MIPFLAASPAWSGFAMVPNWRLPPEARLVARLSAAVVRAASRRSSRAQAAAAAGAPRVDVVCQPLK